MNRAILLFLAFAAILASAFPAIGRVEATGTPVSAMLRGGAALLGQAAPDYAFPLLETPERSQSPQDWRGKPVFLNFFASWCVPCRAEHPLLQKLRAATALPVIGVGHYDRVADTQKFLNDRGNPYTLALSDTMGRGGKLWGLNGVPESFILDAQGVVMWNHRGPVTEQLLAEDILPLLRRLEAQASLPQ